MVPLTGLEPVLNCFRQILSLLCLPFHHSGALFILHLASKQPSLSGGIYRRDAEILEKTKFKKSADCNRFSKKVDYLTPAILSPLCLPVPPHRRIKYITTLSSHRQGADSAPIQRDTTPSFRMTVIPNTQKIPRHAEPNQ